MDAATVTDTGTADGVTITDGTGVAVTTNGATIAAGKAYRSIRLRHSHCPDETRMAAMRTVAPSRRGRFGD